MKNKKINLTPKVSDYVLTIPPQKRKVVGVLGGMGPLATACFLRILVEMSPATKDQEHLQVIAYSNPLIPDRTSAILKNTQSPVPEMIKTAQALKSAGADFIVTPCNTAHYFLKEVAQKINLPFISIIDATLKQIKDFGISSAILFATDATILTGLYQTKSTKWGVKLYTPGAQEQSIIMQAIYEVKAGKIKEAKETLKRAIKIVKEFYPAQAVIGGCTEIPLAWDNRLDIPFISSLDALAYHTIRYGYGIQIDENLFI